MPRRRKKKEKDAEGDQVMQSAETAGGEWKTGPASDMEGLESDGVKLGTTTRKKGEHLVKRGAKRRRAKGITKALAVSDKISSRKSTKLKRKALRQSAKQLW